jgi:ribA/ribD-fused uncharacterized protein
MMACKAALFSDTATLELILEETTKPDTNPRDIKALGGMVTPFEEDKWVEYREVIVYVGNLCKFGQNEELRKLLLETGDLIIVEASPFDRIWGIGFRENKAMERDNMERWGMNLLGKALMKVREELVKEQEGAEVEAKL